MTETSYAGLPTTPRDGGGPPDEPLRIAVIAASVRDQRMGRAIAEWAAFRAVTIGTARNSTDQSSTDQNSADQNSAVTDVDLLDCAECDLPDDGLLRPGAGAGTAVSARIDAADAFVFVTPEYNHSYPASLKRLIDWQYREWMFKPATVLSYGVQGGLLATEHLRGVLAELHVVTTRRVVGLSRPWTDLSPSGYAPPADVAEAFDAALHELTWWAALLRTARHERPYAR
ncbi:NAD(P)H-dependent oxidoreductase [Actinoplanes sp. NPDC023801]|uniref:NADPH-dependent FMN reductase n=1 Tax=Actinoplanes sp. NPDC023801 TaxID=3154595 RepID=UPI0033E04754